MVIPTVTDGKAYENRICGGVYVCWGGVMLLGEADLAAEEADGKLPPAERIVLSGVMEPYRLNLRV